MSLIFVTATGTDVGKTYVTCALIRALERAGKAVTALKPVISGFDGHNAAASDSGLILAALGQPCDAPSIAAISPWRYAAPLSAEIAAEREGRGVSFDAVVGFCTEAARSPGVCLIEGVGGLMSPIDSSRTNRDLIAALKARPLLVAGSYLGTVSHILTALEALRAAGVEPLGIVISESQSSPVPLAELAVRLAAFTRAPIVTVGRDEEAPGALVEWCVAKA